MRGGISFTLEILVVLIFFGICNEFASAEPRYLLIKLSDFRDNNPEGIRRDPGTDFKPRKLKKELRTHRGDPNIS